MIEAEHVFGIVRALHGRKPIVVRSIGRSDTIFAFISKIVGVDTLLEERTHRVEERSRPGHVVLDSGGIRRLRQNEEIVVAVAMRKGCRARVNTARQAVHLL